MGDKANLRRDSLAQALLRPINPALIVLLGIYTITWGLWLVSPFWSVFATADAYGTMESIAHEGVWGGISILAGAAISYGAVKRSYHALATGSAIAFVHWFIIGLLCTMAAPTGVCGITAFAISMYAAAVHLNIVLNFSEKYRYLDKMGM